MKTRIITAAIAAGLALAATGCGSGTVTAARYSSVRQVIAALDHGGMRCTGAEYSNPPVVKGAISEASCDFRGLSNTLIDVFPGTVTTAQVLQNSISTGTQKIWSAVGPNWWVQTDRAHVKRVQTILGGRIVGGPWHPGAQSSSSADPAVTVCQKFSAIYGSMFSILNGDSVTSPSALRPDPRLNGFADNMAHWSYVVYQAIQNGTTSASVQLANDLGDAGIAVVQVAEPLGHGVSPNVEKAINKIDAVQSDCSGLGG
jgi:hypothetical protein